MARTPIISNSGAVNADRLRIKAILESPEGQRNPKAAFKLAVTDGLSAATAKDILAGLPSENPYIEYLMREGPVGISGPTTAAGIPGADDYRTRRAAEIREAGAAVRAARAHARG